MSLHRLNIINVLILFKQTHIPHGNVQLNKSCLWLKERTKEFACGSLLVVSIARMMTLLSNQSSWLLCTSCFEGALAWTPGAPPLPQEITSSPVYNETQNQSKSQPSLLQMKIRALRRWASSNLPCWVPVHNVFKTIKPILAIIAS